MDDNFDSQYAESFSLNGYTHLLQNLTQKGYSFITYDEVLPQSQNIVLRHDIDNSLEYALEIAKIEARLSIKGHYFILLSTNFYNLFSSKNKEIIQRILKLGHYIGLHFDASIYSTSDNELTILDINHYADNECIILEKLINAPINHISFHRPVKELLNHKGKIAGRYSTYNELYFSKIGYCSDSGGEWKFGNPLDHNAIKNLTALQLLTHPIWWIEEGNSPNDKLKNFLRKLGRDNIEELKSNSKVFNP